LWRLDSAVATCECAASVTRSCRPGNDARLHRSRGHDDGMSDPHETEQADGENPEELSDGSGPVSHPDPDGDPDQFQG
jgi:hypothetical protein